MPNTLHILCAGAAQGLVKALQANFERHHEVVISARFGAVGAMREALLAGEPCDLMIVTAAMVEALCGSGKLIAATRADLGAVRTGVAVPAADAAGQPALPEVASAAALKAALLGAEGIYFPDPQRATAGIHFAAVMRQLGVFDALQPRFRTYPNGATAMREMAALGPKPNIGCTQISEILYTPGVRLAGALPTEFELATQYTAAVSARAAQAALAPQFVAALAAPATLALRRQGGFEIDGAADRPAP